MLAVAASACTAPLTDGDELAVDGAFEAPVLIACSAPAGMIEMDRELGDATAAETVYARFSEQGLLETVDGFQCALDFGAFAGR
jgi:hypothetical protein